MRVELVTDVSSASGYSSHARALIQSLLLCPDIDLMLRVNRGSRVDAPLNQEDQELYQKLAGKTGKPDVRIHFELPGFYTFEDDVYTIGFTVWETTRIPGASVSGENSWNWPPLMNKCDEIWTSCTESMGAFERSGVNRPIHLITGPVDTDLFQPGKDELLINGLTCEPNKNPIPKEGRPTVLGFIGSIDDKRKNAKELITWMTTQFPRGSILGLLKTYAGNMQDPNQKKRVQDIINDYRSGCRMVRGPELVTVTEILTDEEVASLMQSMDIYVSFSRGEGLDLPTLQAMACGCLVLHTNWGATTDYLTKDVGFPIGYIMEPCTEMAAPYWGDQWCARVHQYQASSVMSQILQKQRENADAFNQMRVDARQVVVDRYSVPAVARQLEARFKEISEIRSGST